MNMLDSSPPGWQNIETCGCVIIESKECGLAALLLIGMSQVSSVNFEQGIKVRASFKKGDMLGYFLFGGSDYMILFQDKVKFSLTVPRSLSDFRLFFKKWLSRIAYKSFFILCGEFGDPQKCPKRLF